MSTYTPEQYAIELNRRLKEISFANKAIYLAVADAHADYVNRIFERGKRATNANIGSYSSSYAKYRQKKKRQTAFVDLKLTTRLSTDIANSLTRQGNTVVNGVKNIKGKSVIQEVVSGKKKKRQDATNSEKLGYIIDRYGKNVFLMSQKERKELDKDISIAVAQILRGDR